MAILINDAKISPNTFFDNTTTKATITFTGVSFSGIKKVVVTFLIHPFPEMSFMTDKVASTSSTAVFDFTLTEKEFSKEVMISNRLPNHSSYMNGLIEIVAKTLDGESITRDNVSFIFN